MLLTPDELAAAKDNGWYLAPYRDTYVVNNNENSPASVNTIEEDNSFQIWLKEYRTVVGDEEVKPFPDVIAFDYYLNDDSFHEAMYDRLEQLGYDDRNGSFDALIEKMNRPFYEVKLSCEVNTETGEVTIKSAS